MVEWWIECVTYSGVDGWVMDWMYHIQWCWWLCDGLNVSHTVVLMVVWWIECVTYSGVDGCVMDSMYHIQWCRWLWKGSTVSHDIKWCRWFCDGLNVSHTVVLMVVWWIECVTYSGVDGCEKAPLYHMILSGADGCVMDWMYHIQWCRWLCDGLNVSHTVVPDTTTVPWSSSPQAKQSWVLLPITLLTL